MTIMVQVKRCSIVPYSYKFLLISIPPGYAAYIFFNDRYIYRKSKFFKFHFPMRSALCWGQNKITRKLDHPNWNFVSSLNEANMKCYTKEEYCLKLQKHLLVSCGAFHSIVHIFSIQAYS